MLDIVFISFNEPNADDNFKKLARRFPWIRRVHGVEGIMNAHKEAAKRSRTYGFYVVDGDSEVLDSFDFSFKPGEFEKEHVHIWRCMNPVNGLVYGYGGIKLFPRQKLLDFNGQIIDFTTTAVDKLVIMDEIASITNFNTSPFDSWKSGFRECVKLSSKIIARQKDDETDERLGIWCNVGTDKLYGKECINGANEGRVYGEENKDKPEALGMINDFGWLKRRFESALWE